MKKNSLESWSSVANIIIALISVVTFLLIYWQHQILNRPYLGLGSDTSIDKGTVYASTTENGVRVNPGMQIQVVLSNYGNRPANFHAEVLNWLGEIKSFQNPDNFIMPEQQIILKWNLMFPGKIDSICDIDKSLFVKISYSDHMLILKPTYIDDPELGGHKEEKFKVWQNGCKADINKDKVRIWYVEKST